MAFSSTDRTGCSTATITLALAALLSAAPLAHAQADGDLDGRSIRRVLASSGDGQNLYRLACPDGRVGSLIERVDAGEPLALDASLDVSPPKVTFCYYDAARPGERCEVDADVYEMVAAACKAAVKAPQ